MDIWEWKIKILKEDLSFEKVWENIRLTRKNAKKSRKIQNLKKCFEMIEDVKICWKI